MSPPPAASGGRTALGRLVDALRRRLGRAAGRDGTPATVPGLGSGEETAIAAAAREARDASAEADAPAAEQEAAAEPAAPAEPEAPDEPEAPGEPDAPAEPEAPAEPGARIDAARERLRSRISP